MNIISKYHNCFEVNSTVKKKEKRDGKEYLDKLISIQPSFGKRKIDHLCISNVRTFYLD